MNTTVPEGVELAKAVVEKAKDLPFPFPKFRAGQRNMAKYVPAFSARKVAEQMGWDMTTIREFPRGMVG